MFTPEQYQDLADRMKDCLAICDEALLITGDTLRDFAPDLNDAIDRQIAEALVGDLSNISSVSRIFQYLYRHFSEQAT